MKPIEIGLSQGSKHRTNASVRLHKFLEIVQDISWTLPFAFHPQGHSNTELRLS